MKKYISFALVILMLLTLCACAPKTETPAEPSPENNQSQAPAPAPQPENNQSQAPVPEKTAKNNGVRPSFDIDTLEYLQVKTTDLKDKTVSLFLADTDFKAGDMGVTEWFSALDTEYGLKAEYNLCSENTLYSSQLIAQKSGKALDLVLVNINDIVSALSLTASARDLVKENDNNPFSKRVFELTDGRLFAAKGNAKMLWYNTNIVKDTPKADWTFEDLSKITTPLMTSQSGILETDGYAEFFSLGKTRATGFDLENGVIMNVDSDDTNKSLTEFLKITAKEPVKNQSFSNKNIAFAYTATPTVNNFKVGYAPLPKLTEDGTNVVSLCGSALALSKTVTDENVNTALTVAMLFSARYSENREDTLQFDLGLDKTARDEYINLCENTGLIYNADSEINAYFTGDFTKDNAENIIAAKARAKFLNKRY